MLVANNLFWNHLTVSVGALVAFLFFGFGIACGWILISNEKKGLWLSFWFFVIQIPVVRNGWAGFELSSWADIDLMFRDHDILRSNRWMPPISDISIFFHRDSDSQFGLNVGATALALFTAWLVTRLKPVVGCDGAPIPKNEVDPNGA